MTTTEFSNEFDALLQAYPLTPEFGEGDKVAFDEYEKSVFLTKAQEELVIELYNGKNPFNDSFEKTEEIRRYLGELIKQYATAAKLDEAGLSGNSYIFSLPEDLWFITYEAVSLSDPSLRCNTDRDISVTPVTQDEYDRIKDNPFRGHGKRRALRLDLSGNRVEIISKYEVVQYLVRYVKKPTPIILTDLTDLTINGIKDKTECELNPVVHRAILDRAVKLALQSKVPTGSK